MGLLVVLSRAHHMHVLYVAYVPGSFIAVDKGTVKVFAEFKIRAIRGAAALFCSWPKKSRKMLARDVMDFLPVTADLVYDVTDTDCWAQYGSIHGRVFGTVKR